MDKEKKGRILAVPFPSHGHINPMMQLCKRLVCKGLKATLTLTKFYGKKNMKEKSGLIQIETISDGDDEYDIFDRQSVPDSVVRFTKHGSESIAQLIEKYESLGDPIVGVIYDSLLPWVVEVPKKFGLVAIEFFTQHSGVNLVEYHYYHKLIPYPVESPVTIPGLPLLQPEDVPSYGVYLGNFTLMASQFSTVDKADFAVVNTFYKMEEEVSSRTSVNCPFFCGDLILLLTASQLLFLLFSKQNLMMICMLLKNAEQTGIKNREKKKKNRVIWRPLSVFYVSFISTFNENLSSVDWKKKNCH